MAGLTGLSSYFHHVFADLRWDQVTIKFDDHGQALTSMERHARAQVLLPAINSFNTRLSIKVCANTESQMAFLWFMKSLEPRGCNSRMELDFFSSSMLTDITRPELERWIGATKPFFIRLPAHVQLDGSYTYSPVEIATSFSGEFKISQADGLETRIIFAPHTPQKRIEKQLHRLGPSQVILCLTLRDVGVQDNWNPDTEDETIKPDYTPGGISRLLDMCGYTVQSLLRTKGLNCINVDFSKIELEAYDRITMSEVRTFRLIHCLVQRGLLNDPGGLGRLGSPTSYVCIDYTGDSLASEEHTQLMTKGPKLEILELESAVSYCQGTTLSR
jgi:hypothetical protein